MDSKEHAEMVQKLKGLELAEYEEELKSERIDWEEDARLFQRQMLFSKKKFADKHILCRNQLYRVRANLWSGQRKRQVNDAEQ